MLTAISLGLKFAKNLFCFDVMLRQEVKSNWGLFIFVPKIEKVWLKFIAQLKSKIASSVSLCLAANIIIENYCCLSNRKLLTGFCCFSHLGI